MSHYWSLLLRVLFVFSLTLIALLVYVYFKHSETLLTASIFVASVITIFSLVATILIEGNEGYRHWIFSPIIPLISVLLFDGLIGVIKFRLAKAIEGNAPEIINQPSLPFGMPSLPVMPGAHFLALIIIILCQVFCTLALLSKLVGQRRQFSHPILSFFSEWASVITLLVWVFTALIVVFS